MGKFKPSVNQARCIGSGDCTETAPAVFQLDENGKSQVVASDGAGDETTMAAARGCPVKAITVVNAETGEQLFPAAKR